MYVAPPKYPFETKIKNVGFTNKLVNFYFIF